MIILWLCLLLGLSNTFADDLEVKVHQGTIRGYSLKTRAGTTVRAFRGVPYAHPPTGSLRFQAPQAPTSWTGVRNTTQDAHSCYQVNKDSSDQSEDCLYLNVYVPVSSKKNTTKLPVLIWFHGGGYTHGSPPNPEYLIEEDIIIVTVHYRLGPFGYLATGDTVIPGNAGHKDQAAAIQWTYDNIAGFGGDPKQITISGGSAGAASVAYQLLYNKNKGLIRGAILQSGSSLSPWSYMDDTTAKEYAFELAKLVDSSVDLKGDTTKLRDFLVKADSKKIHAASAKTTITRPLPNLEPKHGGAFLTQRSYELLESGDFLHIPIIIGTTSEEEIAKAANTASLKTYLEKFEKNPASLIPHDFTVKSGFSKDSVGKHIESLYFNNVTEGEKLGHVVRYMSHTSFTLPMIKHADLASNYTHVYFYVFSYHGKLGGNDLSIKGADNVGHGEESRYIWTSADLTKYPAADVLTVKRITNLWGNFIKYLNPTPSKSTLLQNVTWPRFLKNEYKYLDIGSNLSLQTKPKHPYYEEWSKFYDAWAKRPFTTF